MDTQWLVFNFRERASLFVGSIVQPTVQVKCKPVLRELLGLIPVGSLCNLVPWILCVYRQVPTVSATMPYQTQMQALSPNALTTRCHIGPALWNGCGTYSMPIGYASGRCYVSCPLT
jgi:hypothetical protein